MRPLYPASFGPCQAALLPASLAAAMTLIPRTAVEAILFLINAGELPEPGLSPKAMDAWLEQCRKAGAGDFRMTLGYILAAEPPEGHLETEAEFLARLARKVHGDKAPPPPPPGPISLADEMRDMGWM
jgi:hypothetical protein